jgi:hypothetical protein
MKSDIKGMGDHIYMIATVDVRRRRYRGNHPEHMPCNSFSCMEYPYPLCESQRIRRGHGCFANTWQEIKDVFEGGEE